MTSLFEMGFEADVWYEVIVSTYSEGRQPHAAAMGCSAIDDMHVVLKPFKNTTTYRNLIETGQAVLNLTHEPELFYSAVFRKELKFQPGEMVESPALVGADGWVEIRVQQTNLLDDLRAEVYAEAVHCKKLFKNARPYSRVEHALLESLIHYTRVLVFAQTEKHQEAVKLVGKIMEYVALVKRLSRKPSHLQICEDLVRHMEKLVALP